MQLKLVLQNLGQHCQLGINLDIILGSIRRNVGHILHVHIRSQNLFLKAIGSIALQGATAVGSSHGIKNNLLLVSSKGKAQLFQAIACIGQLIGTKHTLSTRGIGITQVGFTL